MLQSKIKSAFLKKYLPYITGFIFMFELENVLVSVNPISFADRIGCDALNLLIGFLRISLA